MFLETGREIASAVAEVKFDIAMHEIWRFVSSVRVPGLEVEILEVLKF